MNIEEDVVRAVLTVYNPLTSNADRIQCTKELEVFRHESAAEVICSVGFALVSKPDEALSFVGWNFLQDIIKFKWNEMSLESRLEMRAKIIGVLQKGLTGRENMTDNLSKTIVAMMEHEWPQNWTDLISDLEQLSQLSPLHCTSVFVVLRRLVENVVTLMTVQNPSRRRDMYNGIVACLPDIIRTALDRLETFSSSREDCHWTVSCILAFFTEICEWVPSSALSPHLNRLVDSLVRLLNTPEHNIYELASRALGALADRKKETSEESTVVAAFFRTEIIEAILRTVGLAAENSETNVAHFRYLKALCGLLTSLGSHLAKVWTKKLSPPNYSLYLSAVCQIFTHPSLNLKVEALDTLSNLSNHSVLGQSEEFHFQLGNVFSGLLTAMEKTGFPSQKPVNQAVHFSNMDYDDDLEWTADLKKLREKARSLLLFGLNHHFGYLLQILDQSIFQEIMKDVSSVPSVKWEPMAIFSKVVVQGGLEKSLLDERSKDGLIAMGDSLIQLMSTIVDCDLLNEVLSIHSSLLPVFRFHPTSLSNYIELLRRTLCSSKGHITLNRHIISLILRVVLLFPDFFKVNVNLIVDLYKSVHSNISQMQQAQLVQVFASLSNIIEPENMKIELLKMCIGPSIEFFSKCQNHFNSINSFISLNGFETASNENFEEDSRADVRRRKELRCHLTIVEGVMQQVDENSPLGRIEEFIIQLPPIFFKLNSVTLELASPKALSLMNAGYHNVSDITRGERETIYCSVGESLEVQLGKLEPERRDTRELSKHYIHQLAMQSMNIISLISSKFGGYFHSHPAASGMLMSTVEHLDIMAAFRLRHWLRKPWKSLITSAPPERWGQLTSVFETLTTHMKGRMEEMWRTVSAIDYDAAPTEAELFNEHMTCVLAREYLGLLRLVYTGSEANQNDPKMSPLGEWLFQHEVGLSSVLYTAFTALTWRDTSAASKAIPLCKLFADKMQDSYCDDIAVNMLIQALTSLQIHGGDEVAGTPMVGLIAHIYISLRKFSDSFPQILVQVPGVSEADICLLDQKVRNINSGDEVLPEKKRRELFRKMLQGIIAVSTSELHRRPVYLRPLPPIEKRRKEEPSPEYEAVPELFGN